MKGKILVTISLLLITTISCAQQMRLTDGGMKVLRTLQYIENLYVDKVDDDEYVEDVVKSMLNNLDPHSTYITAKEVKAMEEPLEGNFDGIGISFNMMTDTLYVIETIAGGPSEKVGIRPGDKIMYVNDTIIAGVKKPNNDVIKMLRGKKGTKVNVKVLRKGFTELLAFTITRDKIPIYSLDASYMVNKETGYVKLSRFGATTHEEFRDACKELHKQGMKNLILDLEYNGGGYLSAAIDISKEFLGKKELIVYTEGTRHPKREERANGYGGLKDGKLIVLINEGSASASEIVAGAIQDQDRGLIVGRRSFGKGLVQRPLPLPDGSLIRLTVARYYTPTGRSIQRPYEAGKGDQYMLDLADRYNKGELMHGDSIHFPDSLKFKTLKNQRIVYGGGGIMPDYYVPLDTLKYPKYYRELFNRGLLNKVAYNEVDINRDDIKKKYPKADDFYKKYYPAKELIDKVIEEGKKVEVAFDEKEFEVAKPQIEMIMKALIARDVYDTQTSFKITNDQSDIFNKALEIISDDEKYNALLTRGQYESVLQ